MSALARLRLLGLTATMLALANVAATSWAERWVPFGASVRVIHGVLDVRPASTQWSSLTMHPIAHGTALVATLAALAAVVGLAATSPAARGSRPVLALGVLAGGLAGSGYERLAHGFLRAFIDIHIDYAPVTHAMLARFETHHLPTLSLADLALALGAAWTAAELIAERRAASRG